MHLSSAAALRKLVLKPPTALKRSLSISRTPKRAIKARSFTKAFLTPLRRPYTTLNEFNYDILTLESLDVAQFEGEVVCTLGI